MPALNRAVVITSIFPPGEAMQRFANLPGWQLIVVADRRTPAAWQQPGACLLSVAQQRQMPFQTVKALPWDHYARKMLGYLWAAREGALLIAESDDDNLPEPGWDFPPFEGHFGLLPADRDFINIYRLFTDQPIWPRGLPLARIGDPAARPSREELVDGFSRIGVWQALADDEPDVDAIYRLTAHKPCRFARQAPVVLAEGTLSPFNSQNTAFHRALLPLMYLPAYVNFRVTDILRSYVAQPIMWAAGYRLGFTGPTVRQARNTHDLMDDFRSELPLYLEGEAMIAAIHAAVSRKASVGDNLHRVYRQLVKQGLVGEQELRLVDAWLTDVDGLAPP
jgi:hypothetical protein